MGAQDYGGSDMKKMWTPEELSILRTHYPMGSAAVQKHLPLRTTRSIKAQAQYIGICVSPEELKLAHKEAIMKAARAHDRKLDKEKPRPPFSDIPDEYIKVGSIFRVGYRYASQVQA